VKPEDLSRYMQEQINGQIALFVALQTKAGIVLAAAGVILAGVLQILSDINQWLGLSIVFVLLLAGTLASFALFPNAKAPMPLKDGRVSRRSCQ
jgi:hypothetical protein